MQAEGRTDAEPYMFVRVPEEPCVAYSVEDMAVFCPNYLDRKLPLMDLNTGVSPASAHGAWRESLGECSGCLERWHPSLKMCSGAF